MARRGVPLLISILMLAIGVAFVVLRATTPDDCTVVGPSTQAWLPDGVAVQIADTCQPEPDGLRSGDVVTAIDGHRLAGTAAATPSWSVGDSLDYTVQRAGRELTVLVTLVRPDLIGALAPAWTTLLFVVAFLIMAGYVAWRRFDATTGALLVAASGLAASTVPWWLGLPAVGVLDEPLRWVQVVGTSVVYVGGWAGGLTFALLFPQPFRRIARWPRWARSVLYTSPVWLVAGWGALTIAGSPNVLDWVANQRPVVSVVEVGTLLAWLGIGIARLRQPMDAMHRQQVRWLVGGAVLAALAGLAGWFVPQALIGEGLPPQLNGLPGFLFLVGLAVAVLRYRLFDLEIVLNRGLVYGLLTAGVVTLYFGAIASAAGLFGSDTTTPAAIVATAVVAVAVNPLRLVLQRVIDRLMYGDRDDPYSALSRLGRRLDLAAAGDAASLLGSVAEDVADALRVPYVEIEVASHQATAGNRPRWLDGAGSRLDVGLTDGDERIGRLSVAWRAPAASFSRADRRLIDDLARRVSAAARELSLRSDLQRSRERLVMAREEERRALRRALHDEVGPVVAGISLRTEAARKIVESDPGAASTALSAVRSDADGLVADIRTLAYDLRPPALDELGLAEALRQHARHIDHPPVTVTVDGDGIGELPAAVEAAAYRIVAEGVANVVRHAAAGRCEVGLTLTGEFLTIAVSDDGCGLPADFTAGVGVSAMRERAAELGGVCRVEGGSVGGAVVRAVIPIGRSDL